MRKRQITQLLEILDTLVEAHTVIKKHSEAGNIEDSVSLLGECQATAVNIGSIIEATEAEDCTSISALESYCEEIYQASQIIFDGCPIEKAFGRLDQSLFRVKNTIITDIPVHLEAVFLPYKASMWDSMESIWQAAVADPLCNAHVIPIPYYDKHPDGSFAQMHYEGDMFPDGVAVTRYDAYDFDIHQPDMVFIHNPYDDTNHVTSVDPFFYSKNLKRFTENLIYIPYFVLEEISPNNRDSVARAKKLCAVQAVANADRVIVQSENIRRVYIDVLADIEGAGSQRQWEEIILGLGSPKFDKVALTRDKNTKLPDTWKRVVEMDGGGRKKIILYNTTVNALLQNDKKMLEKIRNVLSFFKKRQGAVALLWRPHPLMDATLKSMWPHLFQDYKRLVDDYTREGWGIYDNSADLHRAIALSDAYYGDPSSVVTLYKKTGKPVLFQNIDYLGY